MQYSRHVTGEPAPGEKVFLTLTSKKGEAKTVPAILNPVGREVYGASLDPDADDVYEVAAKFQAKYWMLDEEYQDYDLEDPIAILTYKEVFIYDGLEGYKNIAGCGE